MTIEGEPWAVVSLNGGYGSNSLVLKPHVDRSAFQRSPALRRKVAAAVEPELRRQLARVRKQYKATLAGPPLEHLPPDQLRRQEALTTACLGSLRNLLSELHRCRRDVPTAAALVPAVTVWIRQAGFEAGDLERFMRHTLGTPSQEQIEALRRRLEVAQ